MGVEFGTGVVNGDCKCCTGASRLIWGNCKVNWTRFDSGKRLLNPLNDLRDDLKEDDFIFGGGFWELLNTGLMAQCEEGARGQFTKGGRNGWVGGIDSDCTNISAAVTMIATIPRRTTATSTIPIADPAIGTFKRTLFTCWADPRPKASTARITTAIVTQGNEAICGNTHGFKHCALDTLLTCGPSPIWFTMTRFGSGGSTGLGIGNGTSWAGGGGWDGWWGKTCPKTGITLLGLVRTLCCWDGWIGSDNLTGGEDIERGGLELEWGCDWDGLTSHGDLKKGLVVGTSSGKVKGESD